MSRGFYNLRLADTRDLPSDPRFPVAQHIGWTRSTNGVDTEFHTPEPDNLNRVIMYDHPIECKFIEDNVFYRDLARNKWWSFYYVPLDQLDQFDQWIMEQPHDLLWTHNKPASLKRRRGLLHNTRSQSELTLDERLFTMGYYANLNSKYFSDDDKKLLERLGPVRALVLSGDYLQVCSV